MPSYRVEVIEETCIGCSVCAQICPTDVFKIVMKKDGEYERLVSIVEREEACIGCMACVENCPTNSIRVEKLNVNAPLSTNNAAPRA